MSGAIINGGTRSPNRVLWVDGDKLPVYKPAFIHQSGEMFTVKESGYTVRPADWALDKNALRRVRERVFVEEQGVPLELEHDEEDASAYHLIAEDLQGEPIGTGRLLPTGQIGRMAVMPAWRNRGVGRALMRGLLTQAVSDGLQPYLNAQRTAIGFYLGFGFSPVGPEFVEAGIAHQRMEQPERRTDSA